MRVFKRINSRNVFSNESPYNSIPTRTIERMASAQQLKRKFGLVFFRSYRLCCSHLRYFCFWVLSFGIDSKNLAAELVAT